MTDAFNPYRAWLGVVSDSHPPTHYELLGLKSARSDSVMIAEAFRRQMGRLNPHLSGEHAEIAQRISGELADARVVLMTPTTKRAYDAELASRSRAAPLTSGSSAEALLPPSAGHAVSEPVATLVTPPTMNPPAYQPPPPTPATAAYPAVPVAGGYAPAPGYGQPYAQGYPVAAAPQAVPVGYQAAPGFVQGQAYPAQPYPGQPAYPGQPPYSTQAVPVSAAYPTASAGMPQPEIAGPAVSAGRSSSSAARTSSARRSSAGAMLAGILVAGLVVVGGVVYFVNAESASQVVDRGDGGGQPGAQTQRQDASAVRLPTDVERTPSDAPVKEAGRRNLRNKGVPNPKTSKSTEKLFTDEPEPPPADVAMPEKMADAGEPKPSNSESPKSVPASADPRKSATTPPAEAKPEPSPATPEETAAVRKLLSAARSSLAERDFSGAEDQLAQATLEASSPSLLDEVERLEFLARYCNDFWDAVRQRLAKLDAAETINVNGEELSIVEASPDKLIFRAAGKRHEYEFAKLPGKLAFWLAQSWLDEENPASLIVLGAYHAVDAKGDRRQARELFEQAGAKGLDVRLLLAELDANKNDK